MASRPRIVIASRPSQKLSSRAAPCKNCHCEPSLAEIVIASRPLQKLSLRAAPWRRGNPAISPPSARRAPGASPPTTSSRAAAPHAYRFKSPPRAPDAAAQPQAADPVSATSHPTIPPTRHTWHRTWSNCAASATPETSANHADIVATAWHPAQKVPSLPTSRGDRQVRQGGGELGQPPRQ